MRLGARCVSVLSQVALPEEEIVQLSGIPLHQGNPFRLLSLGRLLHWKGFHLGLMAFARFVREFPQSEYWLVGDGPERRNLERLVGDLGIADKVRFWGALPRAQALKKLAECNVLLHPSLHHSGGLGLRGGHGRRAASDLFGFGWSRPAGDRGGRLQDSGPHAGTGGGGNGRGDVEVGHADKTPRRWMSEAARRRVREEYNWSSKAAMLRRVLQEEINVQS
jgi:glycosyltransferase involved in cell wall biosynthesis